MFKILVVLLWPVGIAAILLLAGLLARRQRCAAPADGPATGTPGSDVIAALRGARSSIVGMLLILIVGSVAVYAVTCLIGVLVVHAGPSVDKPIYTWMIHHRVPFWKSAMDRVTKVGNTWTTWGAAGAGAVCLAAFYRKDKWLPPVALSAAIVIDHYLTLALRHTFHRPGPPGSPLGTFPSGGCDRILVIYGLIAYLIWREVSGTRRVAIWTGGVVAALAFSEAYSRGYLTLHWFTDIASGLIYGTLILSVFIATVRLVAGPAWPRAAESPATVPEPVTPAHPDPQRATPAPGLVGAAPDLAAEGRGPQPSSRL